jgi:hypothetical protein
VSLGAVAAIGLEGTLGHGTKLLVATARMSYGLPALLFEMGVDSPAGSCFPKERSRGDDRHEPRRREAATTPEYTRGGGKAEEYASPRSLL